MILGDFLQGLLENGQPVFESADLPRDLGKPAEPTELLLREFDRSHRAAAPGEAPEFDLMMAHHALGALCRLAQFTVFREIPAESIETEWESLGGPLQIESPTPSQTWSVDVVLRHLPELFRIANSLAEKDPLMKPIQDLAKWWPLSGVGIDGVERDERDLEPILADETLATLLVDRVLEKRDRKLAAFPEIRRRLDAAVGEFGKVLAPWLTDVSRAETDGEPADVA